MLAHVPMLYEPAFFGPMQACRFDRRPEITQPLTKGIKAPPKGGAPPPQCRMFYVTLRRRPNKPSPRSAEPNKVSDAGSGASIWEQFWSMMLMTAARSVVVLRPTSFFTSIGPASSSG